MANMTDNTQELMFVATIVALFCLWFGYDIGSRQCQVQPTGRGFAAGFLELLIGD